MMLRDAFQEHAASPSRGSVSRFEAQYPALGGMQRKGLQGDNASAPHFGWLSDG